MSYADENLGPTAREIKQYIYDSTIFETDPEALKGDARWWAGQLGLPPEELHEGLEELVEATTLIKDGEGEDATYIYVPMTVVSPELHGNRE
ncbi:MAG: hypothetical protein M3P51_04830 [Chloroflexota bacterium]|nr:hypothetical protein [Chloroflexota bacterium]